MTEASGSAELIWLVVVIGATIIGLSLWYLSRQAAADRAGGTASHAFASYVDDQTAAPSDAVPDAPSARHEPARKSVNTALALTVLFGPIGLFYSSVPGGILMLLVAPAALLNPALAPACWVGCIVWAACAALDSRLPGAHDSR